MYISRAITDDWGFGANEGLQPKLLDYTDFLVDHHLPYKTSKH